MGGEKPRSRGDGVVVEKFAITSQPKPTMSDKPITGINIMTKIEQIKHNGAVRGLRGHIEELRLKLTSDNWDGIKNGVNYIRLGEAIERADRIVKEMREAYEELKKIQPNQN